MLALFALRAAASVPQETKSSKFWCDPIASGAIAASLARSCGKLAATWENLCFVIVRAQQTAALTLVLRCKNNIATRLCERRNPRGCGSRPGPRDPSRATRPSSPSGSGSGRTTCRASPAGRSNGSAPPRAASSSGARAELDAVPRWSGPPRPVVQVQAVPRRPPTGASLSPSGQGRARTRMQ